MGQRSQLFATAINERDGQVSRQGRYYQWVWGPYMITRAAQVARYLNAATESGMIKHTRPDEFTAAVVATYGVNLTTGEVQGLSADDDVSDLSLRECYNNNGAFLAHLDSDHHWSFLFMLPDGDTFKAVTTEQFLNLAINPERRSDDTVAAAVEVLLKAEAEGHRMTVKTAEQVAYSVPAGR